MADKFKTNKIMEVGSVELFSAKDHVEQWCDRKNCHQERFNQQWSFTSQLCLLLVKDNWPWGSVRHKTGLLEYTIPFLLLIVRLSEQQAQKTAGAALSGEIKGLTSPEALVISKRKSKKRNRCVEKPNHGWCLRYGSSETEMKTIFRFSELAKNLLP